jgi:hypothetical protein
VRRDSPPRTLAADELLLKRDVLDSQIVDTVGKRLERVGDIELAREPDGTLVIAGVEIGATPVLRRLGFRRRAARRKDESLDWRHVHIARGRGHELLVDSPRAAVHRLTPVQLADVVEQLSIESGADVLHAQGRERAHATLKETAPAMAKALGHELKQRRNR